MNQQRLGAAYAIGTYLLWGVLPLFWKRLAGVDPFIILAHRIVWSAAFLELLHRMGPTGQHPFQLLRSPQVLIKTAVCSALISANWGVYIWAVGHDLVTECSLGYFMAPIGFALLGVAAFSERPSSWKITSILLAVLAVLLQISQERRFEPVSLLLMLTICFYGAAKKGMTLPAARSVLLETAVMFPLAAAFLLYRGLSAPVWSPLSPFGAAPSDLFLLLLAGPITAVPLLLFGEGIKRISLTAQGVVQYLSPTLQFLIAVFVFGEPWSRQKLAVFSLIWLSVAIYLLDILLIEQKRKRRLAESDLIANLASLRV